MIASFINNYFDGKLYYYDLIFNNDGETLLRLGGVIFDQAPDEAIFIERATQITLDNLPDYELTQVIF